MNWFKKSHLWDEIKKYGPKTQDILPPQKFPYEEGEYENLVKEVQKRMGWSRPEAEQYVNVFPEHVRREYFTQNYGWSVPSEDSMQELKNFIGNDTVLEVGAGYGLWAKLMQEIGVKIIPTTRKNHPDDLYHVPNPNLSFTDVEDIESLNSIKKYPNANVLMMIWPPYDDTMAYQSLKSFNGNKLIYVGEGSGGCTGCDKFHGLLNKKWKLVKNINIPRWVGIHDYIMLYERK